MKLLFNKSINKLLILFLLFVSIITMTSSVSSASSNTLNQIPSSTEKESVSSIKSWHEGIDSQLGGQFRVVGSVSFTDDDSIYSLADSGPYYDGNANFRLKNKTYFNDMIYLTAHYEAVLAGGETRNAQKKIEDMFPNLIEENLISNNINDNYRFFDFSKTLDDENRYILYHRLDRFSLTLHSDWSTLRIGRQAITWGNGLVFNPIDLFNPFAPTDIERDYKMGDDMINAQISYEKIGDLQLLYVPRRDPEDQDVKWTESSLAGKIHFTAGITEFDIITAHHYKDIVAGISSAGYLMDAAWRLDVTWTFIDEDSQKENFLSLIANIDYSWVWSNKNLYGFVELYFNGIGNEKYSETISDPIITERLLRGDLFVLGKKYISTGMQAQAHPLVNVYLTVICNIADPSAVFQPRIIWDAVEDIQLTLGGNINIGPSESEFGGFTIPGTNYAYKTSDTVYLWLTCYF